MNLTDWSVAMLKGEGSRLKRLHWPAAIGVCEPPHQCALTNKQQCKVGPGVRGCALRRH